MRAGCAVLAVIAVASRAHADAPRWALTFDVGGGAMLSSYQRAQLDYGAVGAAGLRGRFEPSREFAIEVGVSSAVFPVAEREDGYLHAASAGLRLAPFRFGAVTPFVDAHAGFGLTGPLGRAVVDVSGGVEVAWTSALSAGLWARWSRAFATADDHPSDADFLTAGVALTWRTVPEDPVDPSDRDGDGVRDELDRCPDVPRGPSEDPARPGCPSEAQDSDADGVRDLDDECPNVPAGEAPHRARPGCPTPPPPPADTGPSWVAQLEGDVIRIQEPVYFAFGEDEVLAESTGVLESVARVLREHVELRRVVVEGHTDDVGSRAFNQELSERRAANVVRALVGLGVDASRLTSRGYGNTRPLVAAESAEARSQNRRVEFRVER